MFEGIRGPGYEGDIAIDDVSITIGKCKQDNTVASAGKTGKIVAGDCRYHRGNYLPLLGSGRLKSSKNNQLFHIVKQR